MSYSFIEFAIVAIIVAYSAYHVAKLLVPGSVSRLRLKLGKLVSRGAGRGRMQTIATRLQSVPLESGCGSCGSSSTCRTCAVTTTADNLTRIDARREAG